MDKLEETGVEIFLKRPAHAIRYNGNNKACVEDFIFTHVYPDDLTFKTQRCKSNGTLVIDIQTPYCNTELLLKVGDYLVSDSDEFTEFSESDFNLKYKRIEDE